jgi:pimeloyl-ACP methyl ester carboxylesterase
LLADSTAVLLTGVDLVDLGPRWLRDVSVPVGGFQVRAQGVAERAAAALVPHRKDVFAQEQRAAAWERIPSTYVVCGLDNAIPPAAQEHMSSHAGTVSHLEASHWPFLSRPHDVTAIIQEALAVVVAEAGA